VAGANNVDHVEIVLLDQPVEVDVDEVEARRRAPVAEEARLDVILGQRDLEQRIVEEVDLASSWLRANRRRLARFRSLTGCFRSSAGGFPFLTEQSPSFNPHR
jgi:hypothetical protein